jgi:excinuclease UvrABC helicase subunit UvrB
MLNFDDLYNQFFNGGRKKLNHPIQDEIKKLIESIANFKKIENETMLEKEIDLELGKPNIIETRIEGDLEFKKLTWHKPEGTFVKIIVSDVNADNKEEEKPKEKSLDEQLKEAVESENYELAIQLRDKIKASKKTRKTKKEKNIK